MEKLEKLEDLTRDTMTTEELISKLSEFLGKDVIDKILPIIEEYAKKQTVALGAAIFLGFERGLEKSRTKRHWKSKPRWYW